MSHKFYTWEEFSNTNDAKIGTEVEVKLKDGTLTQGILGDRLSTNKFNLFPIGTKSMTHNGGDDYIGADVLIRIIKISGDRKSRRNKKSIRRNKKSSRH